MSSPLLEQLALPENLLGAWRAVRGNIPKKRREQAAGPDGISLAEYEQDLAANLAALREELLTGRYEPTPPARIELPKRGGGRRLIGVLTVRDRVAQRAAHQVLEPLFEPTFLDCSYGFRPARSVEDAVAATAALRSGGHAWVVDGDIADCFGSLDHRLLLALLTRKVKERPLLGLVEGWLQAGVLPAGPPSPDDDLPPGWWRALKGSTQTGLDWTLEALLAQAEPFAPAYPAWQPGPESYDPAALPAGYGGSDLKQEALKRLVVGGVALGLSGARAAAGTAARRAAQALNSPQGRELLRRRAMTTGGAVGAAALLAAGAVALAQRRVPGPVGTLQGSPLSPLLANVYLHPFDVWLTGRGHQLVRYADDWLILCPDAATTEAAYRDALHCLEKLRLKVNPVKTRLLTPQEKVTFLGATIKGVR